jgi:hypothetical protein
MLLVYRVWVDTKVFFLSRPLVYRVWGVGVRPKVIKRC